MKDRTVSLSIFQETEIILKLSRQIAARTTCSDSKRHSFGVPSRTSVPVPSVRIVLSEPFGADCIPGGVSPWGLDAGAPPTDLVLSGPGFPCGCVTVPLELVLVDGSLGFDWEKATDAADKTKAAVRAMSTRDMAHL